MTDEGGQDVPIEILLMGPGEALAGTALFQDRVGEIDFLNETVPIRAADPPAGSEGR